MNVLADFRTSLADILLRSCFTGFFVFRSIARRGSLCLAVRTVSTLRRGSVWLGPQRVSKPGLSLDHFSTTVFNLCALKVTPFLSLLCRIGYEPNVIYHCIISTYLSRIFYSRNLSLSTLIHTILNLYFQYFFLTYFVRKYVYLSYLTTLIYPYHNFIYIYLLYFRSYTNLVCLSVYHHHIHSIHYKFFVCFDFYLSIYQLLIHPLLSYLSLYLLPIYLPTYIPTYLSTYLPTYLPI